MWVEEIFIKWNCKQTNHCVSGWLVDYAAILHNVSIFCFQLQDWLSKAAQMIISSNYASWSSQLKAFYQSFKKMTLKRWEPTLKYKNPKQRPRSNLGIFPMASENFDMERKYKTMLWVKPKKEKLVKRYIWLFFYWRQVQVAVYYWPLPGPI